MNNKKLRKILDAILVPVLAIVSGLLVMAVMISITGAPIGESYKVLLQKSFGCVEVGKNCPIFSTLERATPIILTGLSATVAFRSGMFSIGQEGQFLMGSAMAAWLGYAIHLPFGLHQLVIIIASMAAGAAYGYIPGILRVKLKVNVLLSTIMLNLIAIQLFIYLVEFPMRGEDSRIAHSPMIDKTAELPIFFRGAKFGWGFVIAVIAVIIVYLYLWKTKKGYEQRMAGQAPRFALFGGIPSDSAAVRAMIISGALSGLAGAIEVLGVNRRIMSGFGAGLGFDGLTASILGQTNPFGTFIVAILFAGIKLGSQLGLQLKFGIPRELGGTITGFIVFFVAARKFYENNIQRVRDWFEERASQKAKKEEVK